MANEFDHSLSYALSYLRLEGIELKDRQLHYRGYPSYIHLRWLRCVPMAVHGYSNSLCY